MQQGHGKTSAIEVLVPTYNDSMLLFCQSRVEVTSCFVYKVMGFIFHNRINTQLIYQFELAQVVARRITKPQRFFRFESHWLLFLYSFFIFIFGGGGGGGGSDFIILVMYYYFYLSFRVYFQIGSSLCCYRCFIYVSYTC